MNIEDIVSKVIDVLERLNVPYMLTGSLANMAYMQARATADADFVVVLDNTSISTISQALGTEFALDPQMSFETATMTTRYKLRHGKSGFAVELFLLSDDAHDQERFRRRRFFQLYGRNAAVVTAEDSVIMKVRWLPRANRPKDRLDAEAIIRRQMHRLDWPYILHWCSRHGTVEIVEEIRHKVLESQRDNSGGEATN